MPSVDDRIVRMEFDNATFEKKLGTTLTSLDKLDKALKFEGAAKSISNVGAQANKMDFSKLTGAVTGIGDKFKAASVIGITALANIATKAISVGTTLVKRLTLDNILAGFHEYETNIGSIQTILANTKAQGTTLKDVNGALDQLNTYSDKTIYNFGQMAKNIGTFTAAGVDLDTSVQSIKGISNLAAISGSSADQASTAMYQLSQAISTGAVKLQDWNSVVNAGMGGRVFQEALFESGKALGTIKKVPIGQTFKEWTDAGNSFRGSLQKGWVTSEVLTTTLQGFTGEMTKAQLKAKGFTDEQAKNIIELGKTGVDAATQVRTLSGLIDTTKEAIGSGWSKSFRIVFGDFKEATKLFTDISTAVGKMVGKSADARNELLQGWKDLGGRTLLIETLKTTIRNLGKILKPIKDAFREVFPPMTAKRLFALTESFNDFAKALKPSKDTIFNITRIFKGFFNILALGWEVIKQTAKFVKFLFNTFTGAGSGAILEFFGNIFGFFSSIKTRLVEGKGLNRFFKTLRQVVRDVAPTIKEIQDKVVKFFKSLRLRDLFTDPIPYLRKIRDRVIDFLKGFLSGVTIKAPEGLVNLFGRLQQRFETLRKIFDKVKEIWRPFKTGFDKVVNVLDTAWDAIKNWFVELKDKLAKVMKPGDFDAVVDAVNVGLVGGILVTLRKFFKKGLKLDIGEGLLKNISKSFETLTGTMKAMQTEIKANALLKIAGAIGILTASVLVLSLIDSGALTKALTAMAIGFGQLMGAFVVINKQASGKDAASFATIATGMVLLSTSILILSAAMKVLATMDWEEIGKGLAAIAGLMVIMAVGVKLLKGSGMVRVGVGMLALAIAINILAGAVKLFSMMDWEEMGKGLVGVAGALVAVALGMKLMPKGLALQGVGLLLVATSLNILAGAVALFATMDWESIGKGMVGIGGSLLLIAGAMQLMPPTMPLIGAGLLLVSISLIAIAKAMQMMGDMDWGEIAKGLVAMGGALLILAIAANAMSSAIVGAVAIAIMAGSMMILSKVLIEMSGISWGDLLKGLVGIAGVLAVLAVAALLIQPAIPALLLLGGALVVVGAGFALFGFGANLVAKAFETFAKVGPEGAKGVTEALKAIGKALPAFFVGLGEGLLEIVKIFVKAAPVIAKGLVVLLDHILDGLGKLLPKVLKLIGKVISGVLDLIRENYPKLVKTGIGMLLALLEGIRDGLPKIVHLVGDIIVGFLEALTEEIPRVAAAVRDFIVTVIETAIVMLNPVGLLVTVADDMIGGFLGGLDDAIGDIFSWFTDKIAELIDWVKGLFGIHSPATTFASIGKDLLLGLLNGIKEGAKAVWNWFKTIVPKSLRAIGRVTKTLFNKGKDFITGLLNGLIKAVSKVTRWMSALPGKIFRWMGRVIKTLWDKGIDLIQGLLDGIIKKAEAVALWFGNLELKVLRWIGGLLKTLVQKGKDLLQGLWNGVLHIWEKVKNWFTNLPTKIKNAIGGLLTLLTELGGDLIEGLWNGIQWAWDAVGGIASWLASLPGKLKDAILNTIGDPLEFLAGIGKDLMDGLWNAVKGAWDAAINWIEDKIGKLPGWLKRLLGIDSPSKIMMDIGEQFIEGFVVAIKNDDTVKNAGTDFVNRTKSTFRGALNSITDEFGSIQEFNPRIRPVLDLTAVQAGAKQINGYIQGTDNVISISAYKQAQKIAADTRPKLIEEPTSAVTGPGSVNFNQIINAPKQLSTNDIYKQTRNQITMAKEELKIS